MDMPKNETPPIVSSFMNEVLEFLGTYGWHIVFALVIANLLWTHLRPKLKKWRERREDQEREDFYQSNPDRLLSMQESLEASRRRLQEQHDRIARMHAEKLQEAEEQKRQEKVKKWESIQRGSSYRPPETTNDNNIEQPERPLKVDKGKRLRGQDYNPLMGSGGGTCFRPSRGTSSGG